MSTADTLMLTISHQYGSGGTQIARALGDRLQWSVWDKEIVRKIATEYQLAETDVEAKDERVATFIEKLVDLLGLGGFTTAYSILPPRGLDDATLSAHDANYHQRHCPGGPRDHRWSRREPYPGQTTENSSCVHFCAAGGARTTSDPAGKAQPFRSRAAHRRDGPVTDRVRAHVLSC